jgi:hypothetical protein
VESSPARPPSFNWMYVLVLLLVALPTVAAGVYIAMVDGSFALLAAGCASIVAICVTWPLARAIDASREAHAQALRDVTGPLAERMQQLGVQLNQIGEQQLLSDRAKAVAYREKDRDALRRAIYEELGKKDFEAAMALANSIETEFGYKQEADRFRGEIRQRYEEVSRKQVTEALTVIDRQTREENWAEAKREAERLAHLYPHDAQVKGLPQEIENRRNQFKRQLLDRWNAANARNDVDGSIELLKHLDLYLTPAEAEPLQEQARHMFKEKLHHLRTQFSVAVQDHKWQEALRIGDSISRDFPNTRIAEEVRAMMAQLRERAAEEEPVGT